MRVCHSTIPACSLPSPTIPCLSLPDHARSRRTMPLACRDTPCLTQRSHTAPSHDEDYSVYLALPRPATPCQTTPCRAQPSRFRAQPLPCPDEDSIVQPMPSPTLTRRCRAQPSTAGTSLCRCHASALVENRVVETPTAYTTRLVDSGAKGLRSPFSCVQNRCSTD